MSKRKWHDRVREIGARNPSALPSFIRKVKPSVAWDRVEWQMNGSTDLPASSLARPILVALSWLHQNNLLTPKGTAAFAKAQRGEALENLALEHPMVVAAGQAFLDREYAGWRERWAANLTMSDNAGLTQEAVRDFEALWK